MSLNQKLATQANLDNIDQFNSVRYTIMIYTFIAFLIILLMAYIFSKKIINLLRKIQELAQRLSNYDFSTPIAITRKDEFGQIGNALNTAQSQAELAQKLNEIVQKFKI